MPKSHLKLTPHLETSSEQVIEVWHEDKLIASIYGSDGPGVRVISKYPMHTVHDNLDPHIGITEIQINPT